MPPVPKAAGAASGAGAAARKAPHRTSRPTQPKRAKRFNDVEPQDLSDQPVDPPGAGFKPDAKADPGTDPADELVDSPKRPDGVDELPQAKPGKTRKPAKRSNANAGGPTVPSSVPFVGGQDAAGAVLGLLSVAFLINVLKGTWSQWLAAKFLNKTPASAAGKGAGTAQHQTTPTGPDQSASAQPSAFTTPSTSLLQAALAASNGTQTGTFV